MLRSTQVHALFRWHKLKGCEHFSVYAQAFFKNSQTQLQLLVLQHLSMLDAGEAEATLNKQICHECSIETTAKK